MRGKTMIEHKYRGINGQCLKCEYMKLATGRKSFCTCQKGYLQNQNRIDCKYFSEVKL